MKSPNHVLAAAVSGTLLLGALAGCASSATAQDAPQPQQRTPSDYISNPPENSQAQDALLTQPLTAETYREAFANYQKCMSAAGFDVFGVKDDGVIIKYSIPDAAVQAGVHQVCYPEEFAQIDTAWQLANEGK
ncbi:MAG: hypothetical protein ABJB03_07705 [Rhodoglobus sp.]